NVSEHPLQLILSSLNDMIRQCPNHQEVLTCNLRNLSGALSRCNDDGEVMFDNYPRDRMISDLVGALASLAHSMRVVFVVEDIDRSNPLINKFVEQLCIRAAELPITVLITCRSFSPLSELGVLLTKLLVEGFSHIPVGPMPLEDIRRISLS